MATQTGPAEEFLTASIDDYLLALAEGIHKAQKQLSQISTELQPGQPAVTYQLPRVEFELKMAFELGQESESKRTAGATSPSTGKVLRIRPIDARRSDAETLRAEAASTVKGSFVAVPALGGKPPPVVRTSLRKRPGRHYEINVDVQSSAGEKLAGTEVQFNVDWDLSNKLNSLHNLPAVSRSSGLVSLRTGVARTDSQGRATNLLSVSDADEAPPTLSAAVLIDVLGQTETVTFRI